MLVQRAVDYQAAVVFVNTVGGQDELVFDGHSVAVGPDGTVLARCPQFEESLAFCTIDPGEVVAARLRDTRHRANVRRQRRTPSELPVAHGPSLSDGRAAACDQVDGDVAPVAAAPRRRRSTRRFAPGCATTSRRTASSTSCSGSPAASTPRSWR